MTPTLCQRARPSSLVLRSTPPTARNNIDNFDAQLDEIPLPVHVENPIQTKSLLELENNLDELLEIGEQEASNQREASIPDLESASITHTYKIFDLLGNYIRDLKTIKHPRISNTELLNGVDRVSHNIEGCINLVDSTLQHHGIKVPQVPERSSPRLDRTGDIFSRTD